MCTVFQRITITSTLLLFLSANNLTAQQKSPKYAAKVPTSITTPDKVHSEFLGDLDFFDGMPSKKTTNKVYDYLDFSRGTEAFLNGIPATSAHAAFEGLKEAGVQPGELGIFEELMDARSIFLTANTTTVY